MCHKFYDVLHAQQHFSKLHKIALFIYEHDKLKQLKLQYSSNRHPIISFCGHEVMKGFTVFTEVIERTPTHI
jgi:hypothetical protein